MSRMSRSAEMLQYECSGGIGVGNGGGAGGGGGRRYPSREQPLAYVEWGAGGRGSQEQQQAVAQAHLYSVSQRLAFGGQQASVNPSQQESDKGSGHGSNASSCSLTLASASGGSLPSTCPSTCPASSPPANDHDNSATYAYFTQPQQMTGGGESRNPCERDTNEVVVYLWTRVAVVVHCPHAPTAGELLSAVLTAPELSLSPHAVRVGHQIFSIWICSKSLEVELGSGSSVASMCSRWPRLLKRWSEVQGEDEEAPLVRLQRSATCPRRKEDSASREIPIAELLWAEACARVLCGRYPVERAAAVSLGSLQARLTLAHPISPKDRRDPAFFREFLPKHAQGWSATKWGSLLSMMWWWRRWGGGKGASETRLLEQLQPNQPSAHHAAHSASNAHKLRVKYLDYCKTLPFYGSVFFQGQVERPVRGLASLLAPGDVPVLVAINQNGVYVIDDVESTMLLGLRYEELSWESCVPGSDGDGGGGGNCCSQSEENHNMPCLFLQFMVVENGLRVSKILQIFSRQTKLMDSLIEIFAGECRKKLDEEPSAQSQGHEGRQYEGSGGLPPLSRADSPSRRLANKLSRLSLATLDLRGELLGGVTPREPTQVKWTPIRILT